MTVATAVQPRYISGRTRMASIAILTSLASIFLPTYSGVRPTIRPATKIARMTNSSIPYMPAPTPPMMISPSWILMSGIIPPSAVKESCMALTAPHEASVVMTAKSEEATTPKPPLLASLLAAEEAEGVHHGGAVGSRPVADDDARHEQKAHHPED